MISKVFPRLSLTFLTLAAAALAAAVASFALLQWATRPDGLPGFHSALRGFSTHASPQVPPPFSLADESGRALTLADFRGRVVLLNFWATWCVPCVEEMPSLDRLQAKLGGDRFTVVAVSTDRQGLEQVKPFIAEHGIRHLAIYLDSSQAAMHAFGLRGIPTTMLIDREGREVGRAEGSKQWDSDEAEALIRHYLGAAPLPAGAQAAR